MKGFFLHLCFSYKTFDFVNEFKRGRTNIEDALRSRGPRTSVRPETVDKVYNIVRYFV